MDWAQAILSGTISAAASLGTVYLRSYVGERGKNRATKDDIEELTHKVEAVRDEYARGITELSASMNARNSLRILAGEKRLATHQEAYSRWHALLLKAAFEDGRKYADECALWWMDNALYLDAEPRNCFILAVAAARVHFELVESNRGKGPDAVRAVVANMNTVRAAGPAIVKACELPPIAADTGQDVPAEPPQVPSPTVTFAPHHDEKG
ncbi:hypothetical protein QFZ41_003229 [Luteibacter sp. W1I16]|uniref:hypothetical protein n=1 Tax=Luteibacter sp. W1I16 TaxID=3373922 RepID=UPI003D1BEE66